MCVYACVLVAYNSSLYDYHVLCFASSCAHAREVGVLATQGVRVDHVVEEAVTSHRTRTGGIPLGKHKGIMEQCCDEAVALRSCFRYDHKPVVSPS